MQVLPNLWLPQWPLIWSQNGPKRGFFNPFLVHFQARKRSKWSKTIVFLILIQKPFPKRSHMPIIEQISRDMFLSTFSGPKSVKMAKKYSFHHFHLKTISKQESHAYVLPNLNKYVFRSQKRIFDPFGHFFGRKKVKIVWKYFLVIFIQNISKKGSLPIFLHIGFLSQKGLFWPFWPIFWAR